MNKGKHYWEVKVKVKSTDRIGQFVLSIWRSILINHRRALRKLNLNSFNSSSELAKLDSLCFSSLRN